jgi:hypothetical protein
MEKEKKKSWTRPQLIVAVRGDAEESVLLGCKSSVNSGGPATKCALGPCQAVRPS